MATYYNSSVAGEAIAGDAIAAVVPKVVTLTTGFQLNFSQGNMAVEVSSTIPFPGSHLLSFNRGDIAVQLSAVVQWPQSHLIPIQRGDIIVDIPLNAEVNLHGNLLRIVRQDIYPSILDTWHTPHFVHYVLKVFEIILP